MVLIMTKSIYSLNEINSLIFKLAMQLPKNHCRKTIKDNYYIDGYLSAYNKLLTALNGDIDDYE